MQSSKARLLIHTRVSGFEAVQVWCSDSDQDNDDDLDYDDDCPKLWISAGCLDFNHDDEDGRVDFHDDMMNIEDKPHREQWMIKTYSS